MVEGLQVRKGGGENVFRSTNKSPIVNVLANSYVP